jgi:hypothetical protein
LIGPPPAFRPAPKPGKGKLNGWVALVPIAKMGAGEVPLARFLLDSRGGGSPYNQPDIPVALQTPAEGHAVRATYMYSGMADVAAMTGFQS